MNSNAFHPQACPAPFAGIEIRPGWNMHWAGLRDPRFDIHKGGFGEMLAGLRRVHLYWFALQAAEQWKGK